MALPEGGGSTEVNFDILPPQCSGMHIQADSMSPLVLKDDDTMWLHGSITSNSDSKCYFSLRRSTRFFLAGATKMSGLSMCSFGNNRSGNFEDQVLLPYESRCELRRARSNIDLNLWVQPQEAPPPRLKVIDPRKEREYFRRQLQRDPDIIAAIPCLPRFASGQGVEYMHTRTNNNGVPMMAGAGQYGSVYLARHNPTGQLVTIKLLSSETTTLFDLALEASINQHLEVTTVVPNFWGIGIVERDDRYMRYCLLQEYVGNARTLEGYDINLLVTINKLGQYFHECISPFDSVDWTALCCRIVIAMNSIHQMGVIINDLKGDNILIRFCGVKNHIFFIDFGLARYRTDLCVDFGLQTDEEREHFLACFFITAPEIVYTGRCYEASDVFSLGWLLATISKRCNLPQMRGIVDWCLQPLPGHRPNAKQLLQTTKDIFYDAICRKMLLCQPQYLLSQLWRLYAQSPDNFICK